MIKSPTKIKEYKITSPIGQLIQSGTLDGTEKEINFLDLPLGNYVLELIFKDNFRIARQIVKVN